MITNKHCRCIGIDRLGYRVARSVWFQILSFYIEHSVCAIWVLCITLRYICNISLHRSLSRFYVYYFPSVWLTHTPASYFDESNFKPVEMSKLKRKVTVDPVSGPSDDRKKPSVFERLGPGAVRRQVGNYDDSDSDVRPKSVPSIQVYFQIFNQQGWSVI